DITRERNQEHELVLKSVAIKEIHHRVKNNLQMIASLLRLQGRRTESEETKETLEKCMFRILSIAGTHELLAQNGLDNVKIMTVIGNIKKNLMMSTHPSLHLTITLKGDDFEVSSDMATTVALVVNEVIQNSIKYAFCDRDSGKITIDVQHKNMYSTILICDDGCGFSIDEVGKDSLGLSIVKSLVRDKLHGILNMASTSEGTSVKIEFSNITNEVKGKKM
ncbi:MAG: sensor histidine kinase, partial [Eubacteriaceae bacterium]|nr:sensor histidine kinase [Eubacteriaceae bacterium]